MTKKILILITFLFALTLITYVNAFTETFIAVDTTNYAIGATCIIQKNNESIFTQMPDFAKNGILCKLEVDASGDDYFVFEIKLPVTWNSESQPVYNGIVIDGLSVEVYNKLELKAGSVENVKIISTVKNTRIIFKSGSNLKLNNSNKGIVFSKNDEYEKQGYKKRFPLTSVYFEAEAEIQGYNKLKFDGLAGKVKMETTADKMAQMTEISINAKNIELVNIATTYSIIQNPTVSDILINELTATDSIIITGSSLTNIGPLLISAGNLIEMTGTDSKRDIKGNILGISANDITINKYTLNGINGNINALNNLSIINGSNINIDSGELTGLSVGNQLLVSWSGIKIKDNSIIRACKINLIDDTCNSNNLKANMILENGYVTGKVKELIATDSISISGTLNDPSTIIDETALFTISINEKISANLLKLSNNSSIELYDNLACDIKENIDLTSNSKIQGVNGKEIKGINLTGKLNVSAGTGSPSSISGINGPVNASQGIALENGHLKGTITELTSANDIVLKNNADIEKIENSLSAKNLTMTSSQIKKMKGTINANENISLIESKIATENDATSFIESITANNGLIEIAGSEISNVNGAVKAKNLIVKKYSGSIGKLMKKTNDLTNNKIYEMKLDISENLNVDSGSRVVGLKEGAIINGITEAKIGKKLIMNSNFPEQPTKLFIDNPGKQTLIEVGSGIVETDFTSNDRNVMKVNNSNIYSNASQLIIKNSMPSSKQSSAITFNENSKIIAHADVLNDEDTTNTETKPVNLSSCFIEPNKMSWYGSLLKLIESPKIFQNIVDIIKIGTSQVETSERYGCPASATAIAAEASIISIAGYFEDKQGKTIQGGFEATITEKPKLGETLIEKMTYSTGFIANSIVNGMLNYRIGSEKPLYLKAGSIYEVKITVISNENEKEEITKNFTA